MARSGTVRFTRYSAMSLITVPVGYALLLLAREVSDLNAGLLNLVVGTVLTGPSFLLYRHFVWPGSRGRDAVKQLFSFWQTVMLGALASSVLIGAADHWLDANGVLIVVAGLVGQGVVFIGRYFWLDVITFRRSQVDEATETTADTPGPG